MASYALITMIESNENNLNEQNGITFSEKRLYEDEAILCFENWRKNAGWLKDINIYAFCPTKNTITQKTKEAFQKLNVIYIEEFLEETKALDSGFWIVPLCGMKLEERLSEDVFIHIDLDMNLIKPLSEEMIHQVLKEDVTLVGQYDDISSLEQRRIGSDWDNPLDTGFIISRRTSRFYKFFYENLISLAKTRGDDRWKELCSDQPIYFLEEYVIDKAYNEKQFSIAPIKKYQVGEGYAPVKTFSDEELMNVYFWHEHILYEKGYYDKIRERLEFTKRMAKLR